MVPEKVVIATRNAAKAAELRRLVSTWGVAEVRCITEFAGVGEPLEDGATYSENARIKARNAAAATGLPALADDSGLEVDALDGRPGIHSARYGGPGLSGAGRVARLLAEMEGVPEERRGASFRAVAVLAWPDGRMIEAAGESRGFITRAPRGSQGFGYDPVFRYQDWEITFAEASSESKVTVDHRGRAMRALHEALTAAAQRRVASGAR